MIAHLSLVSLYFIPTRNVELFKKPENALRTRLLKVLLFIIIMQLISLSQVATAVRLTHMERDCHGVCTARIDGV
jgi:hypothetical protein